MLRALLIAVTLLPIACDKPAASGPAVVAGATAGTVVDVAGGVTATRGGATRALAKGDAISGDDVIATGADGSVTIILAHNQARWTLAANKSYRVSDSIAWSLPKTEGSAAAVAGDTSSAGRHSERQSADTAASVATGGVRGSGSVELEGGPGAAGTKPMTTPTTGSPTTPTDGRAAEDQQRAAEEARAAAARAASERAVEEERRRVAEMQQQLGNASDEASRAAVKAKLEAAKREAERQRNQNVRGDDKNPDKDTEPAKRRCSPDDPLCDDDGGPSPSAQARGVFLGDKELRACAKTAKVTIACADKKCTIRTTTVDATAKACIAKRVTALAPTLLGGKYDVVLEF